MATANKTIKLLNFGIVPYFLGRYILMKTNKTYYLVSVKCCIIDIRIDVFKMFLSTSLYETELVVIGLNNTRCNIR